MAKPKKEEIKETNQVTDISQISPELLAQLTAAITEQVSKQFVQPKEEVKQNKNSKRKRSIGIDFDLEELVPVESIFHGTVECKSRTGKSIVWKECGTTQYLTIGDVIDINSFSDSYFTKPTLLVRDEELSEYLNTTEINNIADKVANMEEFLKLDLEEINEILDKLPDGLRSNVYSEIVRKAENKEIDSLRIIRLLSKKLNIDFEK